VLIKLSTWPGVTQKYSGVFAGINAAALSISSRVRAPVETCIKIKKATKTVI
jgi:phage-related protein